MTPMKSWSYTSATTFEKCPKQYFHLYVAKDVKNDTDSAALVYGNEVHKAAEMYIKHGDPLPEKFSQFQGVLDKLNRIPGEKLCEFKMGLTKDLQPCGFFDQGVWWRGTADLLVLNNEKGEATVVDYKTGKSSEYADTRQLSLLSIAVFKHFPNIHTVKAGLIFLVCKDLVKSHYRNELVEELWGEWESLTKRMDKAHESGIFNASPNFSCRKFCPVKQCPHWGK